MKIVTYNINGIRSSCNKGLIDWIKQEDFDIVCIQEVRAKEEIARELLDGVNQLSLFENESVGLKHEKIFNCGQIAGYSGTLILTKQKPIKVVFGIDEEDNEGRCITAYYPNFAVINCYVPNGSRLNFKYEFLNKLNRYVKKVGKTCPVIFCSDYNVAHTELDLSHPKECKNRTGFLPEECATLTKFINTNNFVDCLRYFNPGKQLHSWRSYRVQNFGMPGWVYMFDYILASDILKNKLISCTCPDLPYSDHMPIILDIDL